MGHTGQGIRMRKRKKLNLISDFDIEIAPLNDDIVDLYADVKSPVGENRKAAG